MFSKSFLRDPFSSPRFCIAALAATLVVVALTACGGGGGGDSPAVGGTPPVVVTPPGGTQSVTFTASTLCASGPALTSTVSQAAANALVPSGCPALPATAYAATTVTVASGTPSLTITGLPAGFVSGVLTATGLASGGTWDVVATATGITVTPRAGTATDWATSYSGTLVMNFAGAPSVSKTVTFVTPPDPSIVVCAMPSMRNALINQCITAPAATGYTWNSGIAGGVWVANVGVRVFNPNTLPDACFNIGDSCWNTEAAAGRIKFIQSDMIPQNLSQNKVVYAYYITKKGSFGDGTSWVYAPLDSSNGNHLGSRGVVGGGVASNIDWVQGADQSDGVIIHQLSKNLCYNFTYLIREGNFVSQSVTCPK